MKILPPIGVVIVGTGAVRSEGWASYGCPQSVGTGVVWSGVGPLVGVRESEKVWVTYMNRRGSECAGVQ